MPLYDFKCEKCEYEVEKQIKLDDKAPDCPKCGRSMTKLMSATSFILKGSGWERDGYGLRGKKKGDK
jgi:putative FmdB family regulatory protein